MFRVAVLVFFIGISSCKKRQEVHTAKQTPEDLVAAELLAEVVGRLAEKPQGFFLNKAKEDPDHPFIVKTRVDLTQKTITLDFSNFAAVLPEPGAAETLSKVMTFPLPEEAATSFDLNNADDAAAFTEVISEKYNDLSPDSRGLDFAGENLDFVYSQCEEQQFKSDASIWANLASGAEMELKYDCRKLQRQSASGLTITAIEVESISEYASNFYSDANRLARYRHFAFPVSTPDQGPDAQKKAIEAFVSLAMVSGLNKMNPSKEETYRGINRLWKSCDKGASDLPGPEPATPVQAAEQFCQYFANQKTFRECSFQSTSRIPNIALMFAGVLKNTLDSEELGEAGPAFVDESPSATGKIPVIMQITGTSGQYIAPFSPMPFEHEVLFKPGIRYQVKAGSAMIALQPANDESSTDGFTGWEGFEVVPCGQQLTAAQTARISHLRLALAE